MNINYPGVPSSQLFGTTTNDGAPAGIVGEYISGARLRSSAVSISNATAADIISGGISLTAGDWLVSACVGYFPAATTSTTFIYTSISQTSATIPSGTAHFAQADSSGQYTVNQNLPATVFGADYMISYPSYRISLAGTANFYLVIQAGFTVSTATAYGSLTARRVR